MQCFSLLCETAEGSDSLMWLCNDSGLASRILEQFYTCHLFSLPMCKAIRHSKTIGSSSVSKKGIITSGECMSNYSITISS